MKRFFVLLFYSLLNFTIIGCSNNGEVKSESKIENIDNSFEDINNIKNSKIIDSILKISESRKFFSEFAINISPKEYNLTYKYLESKQTIALNYFTLFVDEGTKLYCSISPKFIDDKLISVNLSVYPSKSEEHSLNSNIGAHNNSMKISYFEREKVDKLINIYKKKYGQYDEMCIEGEFGYDNLRNLIFIKGNKRIEINTKKYCDSNFEYKKDFNFKDKGKLGLNINAPPHDYNNSEIVHNFIGYSSVSIDYIDLQYFNKEKQRREIDLESKEKLKQIEINRNKQNTYKDI